MTLKDGILTIRIENSQFNGKQIIKQNIVISQIDSVSKIKTETVIPIKLANSDCSTKPWAAESQIKDFTVEVG